MSHHAPGGLWAARIIAVLLALITLLVAWSLAHKADPADDREEPAAAVEAAPPAPNVVIFLIDTLRADRLGAYGHTKATSPHIDALAREGLLFEQAYAPAPWTLPTVVSLFTSTFPCEHGVLVDGQRAAPSMVTLALRLKSAGFVTASFHANPYAGPASGMDAGFDDVELVEAVTGAMVEEWLATCGDKPFFLYIHNIEPHDPFVAPQRLIEQFGEVSPEQCREIGTRLLDYRTLTRVDFKLGNPLGTTDNTEEQVAALERIAEFRSEIDVLYDAAVRFSDERVGQVVHALKQYGFWDNTLFLLLADHGEELGEHGGWQHDQSVYEELVHVPLIVRRPRSVGAGGRINSVVSLVDVMPTILDFAGLTEGCSNCSGVSLRPFWSAVPVRDETTVSIPSMRWNRKKYFRPHKERRGDLNVVVRMGEWKGIFNAESRTLELYDLGEDGREQRDLAAQHPELVEAFRLDAREWLNACAERAKGNAAPLTGTLNEAQLERLKSLGYVE